MNDVTSDTAVVETETETAVEATGEAVTQKRISTQLFISMRLAVHKKGGTIDDLAKSIREYAGSEQTDAGLRAYIGTRVSNAKKYLEKTGEFDADQISKLLPALAVRPRSASNSVVGSDFVDGMKSMLAGLESGPASEQEAADDAAAETLAESGDDSSES